MRSSKSLYILFIFFFISSNCLFAQKIQFQNQIRLAKSFEARGQLEEATKIYTELHRSQPSNYQFYNSLFKILQTQKLYEQSLELVENQIKISKSKVNLYGDLGSVYFLRGNEQRASEIWEEALEFEPENAFAYRTIANYLIENRMIESAIEILKKGNEVSDDHTIFSYDIANYYSITMKYKEATYEYCSILLKKQKQISLITNKIISYINENQATEITLETVEEFYNDNENVVFLKLLSDLYSRTNNHDRALTSIIELEQKSANNGSVLFSFAQRIIRMGSPNIGAMAYKKIIVDYPSSALISEAEIGYTKALELDLNKRKNSLNEWKPLQLADQRNVEDYKNLVSAYEQLIRKYPGSKVAIEAQFRIANIYLENLNNTAKSDSLFNNLLDQRNSLQYISDSYFFLAKIAILEDNLQKGSEYLQKILKNKIVKEEQKNDMNFLLAKIYMWKGEFSNSTTQFNKVTEDLKKDNANDALQYSLLINTFKNDSTNLLSLLNADYLVEKKDYNEALAEFKKLAENKELFILKDFAALRYAELLLALNNYKEASIFLEEISNCDEDNIYKDRYLYLLGSNYYYGLQKHDKALNPLNRIFEEFPNSIYFSKARKIISEINAGVGNSL